MKIILKEDVNTLGFKDDVVLVKDGYGRNFLIPQGKAILATASAQKVLAVSQLKKDAEAIAAGMQGISLTIGAKASSTGKIFGSVSAIQIAEALAAAGFEVDRKTIQIKEAVKEVGSFTATLRLHREVSVEIPFEVVAE